MAGVKRPATRLLGVLATLVALATFVVIAAMASPAAATPAGLRVGAWQQTVVPAGGPTVVHAVDEGRVVFSEYKSSSETSDFKLHDIATDATAATLRRRAGGHRRLAERQPPSLHPVRGVGKQPHHSGLSAGLGNGAGQQTE